MMEVFSLVQGAQSLNTGVCFGVKICKRRMSPLKHTSEIFCKDFMTRVGVGGSLRASEKTEHYMGRVELEERSDQVCRH